MSQRASHAVRPPSQLLLAAFSRIARRRLRRSFRAVRVIGAEHLRGQSASPLIISLNHPSWWDPLLCLTLARRLMPRRTHYAPISAAALVEYPLFARMGMFPVEQSSLRGAAQFLRGAEAVLTTGGVLWVTGQGAFTDVRVQPPVLKPGLGALLRRMGEATVVTLAVEYTFWNQRLPEALVSIGEPLIVTDDAAPSSLAWTDLLASRLALLQNELATLSMQRNPALFSTLLEGGSGTAGVYGAWQWMRARVRGEHASADHLADRGVR